MCTSENLNSVSSINAYFLQHFKSFHHLRAPSAGKHKGKPEQHRVKKIHYSDFCVV